IANVVWSQLPEGQKQMLIMLYKAEYAGVLSVLNSESGPSSNFRPIFTGSAQVQSLF
ncbi:hypothetical protein PanWU01x14_190980, partial [Parasponia andersonii]